MSSLNVFHKPQTSAPPACLLHTLDVQRDTWTGHSSGYRWTRSMPIRCKSWSLDIMNELNWTFGILQNRVLSLFEGGLGGKVDFIVL